MVDVISNMKGWRKTVEILLELIQPQPAHTVMWSWAYVIQYASAHSQINQHTQSFNKAHYIIHHDKCFGLTGPLWEMALSSAVPWQQHQGISYHSIPSAPASIPPVPPSHSRRACLRSFLYSLYCHSWCQHLFEVIQWWGRGMGWWGCLWQSDTLYWYQRVEDE